MDHEFLYVYSYEINENVRIRVVSLEGVASSLERFLYVTGNNFFVTVTVIFSDL